MIDRRVLGKGLDALIPQRIPAAPKEYTHLPLKNIKPGRYQPRQEIEDSELQELMRSIQEKGIVQPIIVRKIAADEYEIVAGGRRFQAAKSLGLNEIPTIIKELDDRDTLIFAIIENLQRKDLNAIEEADAFARLMNEFKFTLDDVAKFLGKDKTTVANTLRLLKLPQSVKDALKKGIISRSQARTILAVDKVEEQERIFHDILNEKLTVREIEKRVKRVSGKKRMVDPFVLEVEEKLQKILGTKIRIFNKRNNRGKIVIEYFTLDDLQRILAKLE
jgi:ParB family transcriptional regulator, chromosome partitioning protein